MGSRARIPVVVLAGFLGSGKTTLLNRLLRHGDGTRIAVVVNDFGAIEIDAMAVAGQVDSMVSLGNGCLCCAVDPTELDTYLDRLAGSGRVDVIVIEASGLAEPPELVRTLLASDDDRTVYGGLVEVVDAAEFTATRARHPELGRHLAVADLVVLNKADRVDATALRSVQEAVRDLSPGTPVVPTSYGRIDPALLFDRRPADDTAMRQLSFADLQADADADEDHNAHLHAAYESVDFASAEPMNPRRLIDFLDTRPDGLYRIKGFVHFDVPGHRQKFTLHAVGRFLRFYPGPWPRDEAPATRLVLIGSGIDADAVRKDLDACRERTPEDGTEDGMWGVLRYVDDDQGEPRE